MRSREGRQGKVTAPFVPGLLRGELDIPGASEPSDFHTKELEFGESEV
jgi:hypothetical protein